MKRALIFGKFALRVLLVVFLLHSLVGCGGGTVSTEGLGSTRFEGEVKSLDGASLAGIEVRIQESGAAALTDSEGQFTIETELPGDSATLLISGDNFSSSATIEQIPTGAPVVSLEIEVDPLNGNVSVSVLDISASVPTPVPAPPSTPRPHETPVPQERTILIAGQLVFNDGTPVTGARVSLSGSTRSTFTDSAGNFRLRSSSKAAALELNLKFEAFNGGVRITKIPAGKDVNIQIKLQLSIPNPTGKPGVSTSSATVSVTSLRVRPR
ncbi:MAG: carboxypeptidase-like regulatory domain-containing protein [Oligoflexia bacterium]|nr:carboxypeptidase-like regulatory domain-containing protein [Oligoflexia bacterium]